MSKMLSDAWGVGIWLTDLRARGASSLSMNHEWRSYSTSNALSNFGLTLEISNGPGRETMLDTFLQLVRVTFKLNPRICRWIYRNRLFPWESNAARLWNVPTKHGGTTPGLQGYAPHGWHLHKSKVHCHGSRDEFAAVFSTLDVFECHDICWVNRGSKSRPKICVMFPYQKKKVGILLHLWVLVSLAS